MSLNWTGIVHIKSKPGRIYVNRFTEHKAAP